MQKKVNKAGGSRVATFFKRNIYYVLMVVCVVAIGTMITVAAVVNNNKGPDTDVIVPPTENPGEVPTEFVLRSPIADAITTKVFSDTSLIHDGTENVYRTHLATDFVGNADSVVVAPFEGVIESVVNDVFYGTTVVINHQNGYKSTLKLLDKVTLQKGQAVKAGDVIGKVSTTAAYESNDGIHVHYELTKDNKLCDVAKFMPNSDK